MDLLNSLNIGWTSFVKLAYVWLPGLLLHLTEEGSPACADLAGLERPAWNSPLLKYGEISWFGDVMR